MQASRPASAHQGGVTGLEVWVVLMELVEVVGVPGGNRNHGEWETCRICKKRWIESEDRGSHFLAQKAVQSLPMLSLHAVLYNTWNETTGEIVD